MASFSHAVSVAVPPAEAFPWLVDEDKVPQWTDGIHAYEVLGGAPAGLGSRIRTTLTVSGHSLTIEYEVTTYEPPTALTLRSETSGMHVDSAFRVEPDGDGARVTQSVDLDAKGMTAKLIAPMVRKQMETKLGGDLERLRGKLG